MTSHELARQLLSLPDGEITVGFDREHNISCVTDFLYYALKEIDLSYPNFEVRRMKKEAGEFEAGEIVIIPITF